MRRRESGSVLILSLWILAVLSVLAGSLAFRARMELRLSQYQWDEIRLIQVAKSATLQAGALWRSHSVGYTALNQSWSDNPTFFKEHSLREATYTAQSGSGYGVEDESARINLNTASREVLQRLFGAHADAVPGILAWRSAAAGSGDYAALGYQPRGGPFKTLDELLLVKGMTPEIFENVKDSITIYGDGSVNLNTAAERVLLALGFPVSLAQKVLDFRRGPDGKAGTEDDGVFERLDGILPVLKNRSVLSDREVAVLTPLILTRKIGVHSGHIRLDLIARLANGASRRFLVVAAARLPDRQAGSAPAKIVYWRESPL